MHHPTLNHFQVATLKNLISIYCRFYRLSFQLSSEVFFPSSDIYSFVLLIKLLFDWVLFLCR